MTSSITKTSQDREILEKKIEEVETIISPRLDDKQLSIFKDGKYIRLFKDIRDIGSEDEPVIMEYMDGVEKGKRPSQLLSPRHNRWSSTDITIITVR